MLDCLNVSYRKVGGLHFLKLGRLNFSWSVSKAYAPIGANAERRRIERPLTWREEAARADYNEQYMARGMERAIAVEFGL